MTKTLASGDPFGQEVAAGGGGGSEMQRGHARGDQAIHLLGKRVRQVAGAQSGFHVRHGNAAVERAQRAGHGGGGVALHDGEVERLGRQYGVERGEDAGGGLGQGLTGSHQVQIVIRGHFERLQHLVEHGAVLGGDADTHFQPGRGPHVANHRAEFDGFRPRAEDEQDPLHASPVGWRRWPGGSCDAEYTKSETASDTAFNSTELISANTGRLRTSSASVSQTGSAG